MGFFSDMAAQVRQRLNPMTIAAEAFETVTDRVVPQGAAEIAQALNLGHGYVPYGPGQEPLPVEPVDPASLGQLTPTPSTQDQYEAQLSMYAAQGGNTQSKGIER